MNSNSWTEVWSQIRKEIAVEYRSPSSVATSALFGIVAVVTIAQTTYNMTITPTFAAGLLWSVLLFAGIIAAPRAMLIEEEQGTGDLIRLIARPSAVYWGKCLYNIGLINALGIGLSLFYILLAGVDVVDPVAFGVTLIGGCSSIAGAVTLCSTFVARAANATSLAAAVAVPMLLFLVSIGTSGFRAAFGADYGHQGSMYAWGLIAYAVGTAAIGSMIFPAVWKK